MKALVEYYEPLTIKVGQVDLLALKKIQEEEKDIEDTKADDIFSERKVTIVKAKDNVSINSKLDVMYKFPFPVKVYRIGLPKIEGNDVKIEYTPVVIDYPIIGVNLFLSKEVPFILLDADDGTHIISESNLKEMTAIVEKNKNKEKIKVKKKRAKRSSKKRKIKGKSSRKGRRV
ncbi:MULTISPECIES: hypothetical protein [Acidianus]|uniref:Uncharacterized protein n=1 Tax=Candidatus Acidianus copahuensis TaxID=1160895 RepID=A0A031LQ17_9CREN|nr:MULTISPECIES: hypothetical protein [Acidianus]EZQ07106.1 hypothetical protein CM19_05630 [Candidatus Acidianus copahuensis]NON61923.1 hypothetical protein [Acidianus sp. RZ1]